MRRSIKYVVWGLLGLLIGTAAYFAYIQKYSPDNLAVLEIQPDKAELILAVIGRVRSQQQVIVRPERAGAIVSLFYDEGASVERGTVLAKMRDDTQRAGLDVIRAQLQALDAQIRQAELKLARTQTLADKGFMAQSALDNDKAALDVALSNKRVAQASIKQARAGIEDFTIKAPITGRILSRAVDQGQVVGAADTLFTVGSQSVIEIEAEVDEYYADSLTVGMSARLSPSGSRDVYDGSISEIAPIIDPLTGGRLVRLIPAGQNDAYLPGRSVDVNIIVEQFEEAFSVPRSAVQKQGAEWHVYVIKNEHVALRAVTFIDWPGRFVIIQSGLDAGDRVILAPIGIKEGQKVGIKAVQTGTAQ